MSDLLPAVLLAAIAAALAGFAWVVHRARRREGELAPSEALLAGVVRSSMDAIVVADEAMRILLFNEAAETTFGWRAADVLGRSVDILLPEFSRVTHRQRVQSGEPDAQGRRAPGKVRLLGVGDGLRADGTPFAAEVSVASLTVDGRPVYSAVIRDVSARLRSEAALRESERRYREVIDGMTDGLLVVDLQNRIQVTNHRLREYVGAEEQNLQGRSAEEVLWAHVVSDDQGRVREEFRERLLGAAGCYEVRLAVPGRPPAWVQVKGTPLRDAGGSVVGALALLQDVTERRRMEDALRRSEANLRNFVDNAVFGFARTTADGKVALANRAIARLLGYGSAEEMIGLDVERRFWRGPEERTAFFERLKGQTEFAGIEVEAKRKDGVLVNGRLSGRLLRTPAGDFDGAEVIFEDVTDRRRLEAQLQQAQKMEAVGQLAGGIAHDFNNLLTVLQFNAELVTRMLPPDRADLAAKVEAMRAAVGRGATLVRKLMASSRKGVVELQPLNLSAVVSDILVLLRPVIPEHVAFDRVLEDNLPPVLVDVSAVEQILLNLVTNARDAMPGGGTLRIRTEAAHFTAEDCRRQGWGEAGDYVRLWVEDDGCGIPAASMERVFEPFFTTKPVGSGSGLGLSMVYGLVRQHGGFVHVASEIGRGTSVDVCLPAAGAAARRGGAVARGGGAFARVPLAEAAAAAGRDGAPATDDAALGGTETILLVEDEEMIRNTVREVLQRRGYRVVLAADGEEALARLRAPEEPVDLIISDVIMPRLGGPGLYERLGKLGPRPPFLLTSGYAAEEAGPLPEGVPILAKPWTTVELLRAVRGALAAGRPPAPAKGRRTRR